MTTTVNINLILFPDLRPVELLYLLHEDDQEYFDEESSVIAIIFFLLREGYLVIEEAEDDFDLFLTEVGARALSDGDLRGYEAQILKIFKDDTDKREILEVVSELKACMQEHLMERGLLAREMGRFLWFFKQEKLVQTNKAKEMIINLCFIRNDLVAALDNKETLGPLLVPYLPIFPGIADSEEFKAYIDGAEDSDPSRLIVAAAAWFEENLS